jgi:hypothetical protein
MHLEQVLLVDRVREDIMVQQDQETFHQLHPLKEILVLVLVVHLLELAAAEEDRVLQPLIQVVVMVQQIQYLVHQ